MKVPKQCADLGYKREKIISQHRGLRRTFAPTGKSTKGKSCESVSARQSSHLAYIQAKWLFAIILHAELGRCCGVGNLSLNWKDVSALERCDNVDKRDGNGNGESLDVPEEDLTVY